MISSIGLTNMIIVFYTLLSTHGRVHGLLSRGSDAQEAVFYKRFSGMKYVTGNTPLEIVYTRTLYECANQCLRHTSCKAFNIDLGNPDSKACELLAKDGNNMLYEYMQPYTNYSYYDTTSK